MFVLLRPTHLEAFWSKNHEDDIAQDMTLLSLNNVVLFFDLTASKYHMQRKLWMKNGKNGRKYLYDN